MIKTFKSRETERIFSRQRSDRIPEEAQRTALRHLRTLDRAVAAQEDWQPIPNGADGHASRYSIAIDDLWRICFEWREGQVYDVEILDGHCR
ncbi:MAG TPA: type II toxin-antitoxin system RelE/ParE family toxin [Candidatus Binatia bacterium]